MSVLERSINVPEDYKKRVKKELLGGRDESKISSDEQLVLWKAVEARIEAEIFPKVAEKIAGTIPVEKLQILCVLRKFTPEMMEIVSGVPFLWRVTDGDQSEAVRKYRVAGTSMMEGLEHGNVAWGKYGEVVRQGSIIIMADGTLGKGEDYHRGMDNDEKWPKDLKDVYRLHNRFKEYVNRNITPTSEEEGHRWGEILWQTELDRAKENIMNPKHELMRFRERQAFQCALIEVYYHKWESGRGKTSTSEGAKQLQQALAGELMKEIDDITQGNLLMQMAMYNDISSDVREPDKIMGGGDPEMCWLRTNMEGKAGQLAKMPKRLDTLIYDPKGEYRAKIENIYVSGGVDIYSGEVKDSGVLRGLASKLNKELPKPPVRGVVYCGGGPSVDLITNISVPVQLRGGGISNEGGFVAAIEVGDNQVYLYKHGGRTQNEWEHAATLRFRNDRIDGEVRVGYDPHYTVNEYWRMRSGCMRLETGTGTVGVLDCPIRTGMRGDGGNIVFSTSDYEPVKVNPISYKIR